MQRDAVPFGIFADRDEPVFANAELRLMHAAATRGDFLFGGAYFVHTEVDQAPS